MKVYLLSAFSQGEAGEPGHIATHWLRESALHDPFGEHVVVDDPEAADIILFVESHETNDPYMLSVTHHPVWKLYKSKCFIYHDSDWAVPVVRGIYPSIGRSNFQPERCRSGGYIARIAPNEFLSYDPTPCAHEFLYSFFGAATSPVRDAIFSGRHPHGVIRDTTGQCLWELRGEALHKYEREYVDTMRHSTFVLCPRGYGPSTYRLFETMEMGRVAVVLSDDWVPPQGPAWSQCILILPEKCVGDIDRILASHVKEADAMGRRARAVWEEWFSKRVSFHRLVEWCVQLKNAAPEFISAFRAWSGLLHPPHRRIWLGGEYRRMKACVQKRHSRAMNGLLRTWDHLATPTT